MNHQEIEASVILAKGGNRMELQKLLEQFKPVIFKTARQFQIKNYDSYDLVQIGYMALIKAAGKYKTGSNTFTSYAATAIRNAYKYTARQNFKYASELSLHTPISPSGDTDKELIDYIESMDNLEEEVIKSEKLLSLRNAVAKLPSDEIDLISKIYYNGHTLKSYAENSGTKYLNVVRKKDKILKKLGQSILN